MFVINLKKLKESLILRFRMKNKNYFPIVVVATAIIVGAIALLIFYQRFDYNTETPIENWVNTAVYFNNLLSPIFLFITILLLYWTWKDTKSGLQQQNNDNNFHIVMNSTSKFADELMKKLKTQNVEGVEVSYHTFIVLLSSAYHLHVQKKLNESKDDLPYVYEKLKDFSQDISIASTYLWKQYSSLTDENHKNIFKLHLYGIIGRHTLLVMLLIKFSVINEFKEKGYESTADLINELSFIKELSIAPHNDRYNELMESLFIDSELDEFLRVIT